MTHSLARNDRIRIYIEGGFANALILPVGVGHDMEIGMAPIDITLEEIPDHIFEDVRALVEKLETVPYEELELDTEYGWGLDFGHYVEVGAHDVAGQDLTTIFEGHGRATPHIVNEMTALLKPYADPNARALKP